MGNSVSSSSTDAPSPSPPTKQKLVPPTDEQVDRIYRAMKEAYLEETKDLPSEVDPLLVVTKLRSKLEREDLPSPMGVPRVASDISDCIAQTKLVRISNPFSSSEEGSGGSGAGEVVAKLEYLNPGLSVKDRIGLQMVRDAQDAGVIVPGQHTVVDITSGNTGIGIGVVCAAMGYKCVQIIPEPYSVERRALMMALGVDVVVTAKEAGIGGALKKYNEILINLGDKGWSTRQFDNPSNIKAHFERTGPEIWEQCCGEIDAIVAGYGTGGTISGATEYLRSKNPDFKCYCVEPMEQSHLNGDPPGPHGIQGLSPPFVPDNARVELFDEVIRVSTADSLQTSRELAKTDGLLVGISAGANVWAARQIANRPEMKGKRIVTILPSSAERYFSTPLYSALLDEAKNLPMSPIDDSVPMPDNIHLNTLESMKQENRQFRPGFKVV